MKMAVFMDTDMDMDMACMNRARPPWSAPPHPTLPLLVSTVLCPNNTWCSAKVLAIKYVVPYFGLKRECAVRRESLLRWKVFGAGRT